MALAGSALVVVAPLLLGSVIAVALSSRGPVFFRQVRVGRGGTLFTLLKLRTMKHGGQGPLVTASGDLRVTPVGRVLRRTKLDELPSLWNVIRGDMALVGPRPEVPEYVDLKDPSWMATLSVRPGIADPVTIRLRNEEELLASAGEDRQSFYRTVLLPYKLRGYQAYIDRRKPLSDLRVMVDTLVVVLRPSRAPVLTLGELREGAVIVESPQPANVTED